MQAVAWLWEFGDGTISNLENPGIHLYRMPGLYSITLHVWDDAGTETIETKDAYVAATTFNDSGGYNVSRTNKCFRYGFNSEQGVNISECSGDDWIYPEAHHGPLLIYDENEQPRLICWSFSDGLPYEIATADGATGLNMTQVWKDKVGVDGTGGTDLIPVVGFGAATGTHERFFIQNNSENIYTRPIDEDKRDDSGYDANGYPDDLTIDCAVYVDGEPDDASVEAKNIALPKHEVVYDRKVEGHQLQLIITANKAPFQITGKIQNLISKDQLDTPTDRVMSEGTWQENLQAPTLWLSRGPTLLLDRAAGSSIDGTVTATTGPDASTTSAMTITTDIDLGNSVAASGEFLIWHKTGYTITGVTLTEVSNNGTWFLSYSDTVPASIVLGAGDVFDVRIYSSALDADTRTYLYNDVISNFGKNLLPQWV